MQFQDLIAMDIKTARTVLEWSDDDAAINVA